MEFFLIFVEFVELEINFVFKNKGTICCSNTEVGCKIWGLSNSLIRLNQAAQNTKTITVSGSLGTHLH